MLARPGQDCAAIFQHLEGRRRVPLFNSPTSNATYSTLYTHLSALLKTWDGNFAPSPPGPPSQLV